MLELQRINLFHQFFLLLIQQKHFLIVQKARAGMFRQKTDIFCILQNGCGKNTCFRTQTDGMVKISAGIFQCLVCLIGQSFQTPQFLLVAILYYGKSLLCIQDALFHAPIGELAKDFKSMACACFILFRDQPVFQLYGKTLFFLPEKLGKLLCNRQFGLPFLKSAKRGNHCMEQRKLPVPGSEK